MFLHVSQVAKGFGICIGICATRLLCWFLCWLWDQFPNRSQLSTIMACKSRYIPSFCGIHTPLGHYDDAIMSEIASQITSLTIVYSTVLSGADQSKHQSSASLAFVWEIHRWPVNFPHKWPVTRKIFPFDDVIMPYLDRWLYNRWNLWYENNCDNNKDLITNYGEPIVVGTYQLAWCDKAAIRWETLNIQKHTWFITAC